MAQVQREKNIARAKAEVEAQQQRIDRTNDIVKENMEDADGSKALQNVINQVQENFRLEQEKKEEKRKRREAKLKKK